MKYTINELANSKGVSQPVREALLQMEAELEATNRQVEILSDALAESRREVAAFKDVPETDFGNMTKDEALDLALEALEHCKDAIIERGLNGSQEFAKKWGLMLPLDRSNKAITAIKQALAAPVQEPEYWNVIDPAGNIVASETDAIRGWARIAGSYKPTVEGLLGFHDQGWRVLPKVTPPAAQRQWVGLTDEMVTAAARALNKRQAEACGVDKNDHWKFYGDDIKEDARAALEAAHNIKERNV